MRLLKITRSRILDVCLLLLLLVSGTQCASIKEILNLNAPEVSRTPRETQYYGSRYSSASPGQTVSSRPIKPEEAPEARERDGTNVEKRCIRCDYYNNRDYKYPYEYRTRYDDYDNRNYRDRYDDRYRDRYYEDYDRRYDTDRKYYDTDRRHYDYDRRYDDRDRYDRDRYDRRPESYDRYDRYDRDRYDDRYKYDTSRYDNRYDNRGYRPWDETYRGSSGFDSSGRGYYFAVGRPEYSNYGSGYASNWNYGGGGGRGGYSDRDRGWKEQGFSTVTYRPRDPYDSGHFRGTSYLYGRPSSTTTTQSPSPSVGGSTVTDNPPTQSNTSSG